MAMAWRPGSNGMVAWLWAGAAIGYCYSYGYGCGNGLASLAMAEPSICSGPVPAVAVAEYVID